MNRKELKNKLDCFRKNKIDATLDDVEQNGLALRHVRDQTPEICLAAVKQHDLALQFIMIDIE